MTATDRFAVAIASGVLIGLVMWALAAMLGPGYMGLLFGGITALAAALTRPSTDGPPPGGTDAPR